MPRAALSSTGWRAIAPRHGLRPGEPAPRLGRRQLPPLLPRRRRRAGAQLHRDGRAAAAGRLRAFVHVAELMAEAGLNAPRVLEADADHGFLLLDDLGDTLYLDALQRAARPAQPARDALMRDAIGALIQLAAGVDAGVLPPYDEALLRRELALFPDWCVAARVRRRLDAPTSRRPGRRQPATCSSTARWPSRSVSVHRDFMPRNLMVARPRTPACSTSRTRCTARSPTTSPA